MIESRKKGFSENRVVTIIGPGTSVTGEIRCKGTVRVEGSVTGRIFSDDTIIILEGAKVQADLEAGQVVIGGEVEGNVKAIERVEVTSKGKLLGDVCSPRLSIADGVLFEGKCSMPAQPASPAA